ncbi:MAG: hypothetical protein J6125_04790 [Clostridia bacterium]|nr:hypothetical protein [Clostridia bacterium]
MDTQRYRERLVTLLATDGFAPEPRGERPDPLAALVRGDGDEWYFSDVDYTDRSTASWEVLAHTRRLCEALRFDGLERFRLDAERRCRVLGALSFFLRRHFHNDNWWYNEIGLPLDVSALTLLLEEYMSEDDRREALALIAQGGYEAERARFDKWSGANMLWIATVGLRLAVLTGDEVAFAALAERIRREFATDGAEGIRDDGSFFQHGPRLYTGGYGRSFVEQSASLFYLLDGTDYDLPPAAKEAYMDLLLEGVRGTSLAGVPDWHSVGREMVRPGGLSSASTVRALRVLARVGGLPRREEAEQFLRDIGSGADSENKTRYFPRTATLTAKADGRYIGVRCLAPGLMGAEQCNGEGVLCHHMTYGCNTCLMTSGREYVGMAGVYDYARIPGTTAVWEDDASLCAKSPKNDVWRGAWYGGAAEDGCGVICQEQIHDGLTLKAAFFTVGDTLVALGCDLAGEVEGAVTTVDQKIVDLPIGGPVRGERLMIGGVTYRGLDSTTLSASVEERRGSLSRNSVQLAPTDERRRVLTVTVAEAGAPYAYAVSLGDVLPITVESNTPARMAIVAGGRRLSVTTDENGRAVCRVERVG